MLKPKTLAMILAGGRVDELNVLTQYRPKSAVPFGGFARVIDFSLSNLMNSGLERVAVLSQYRSYSLINHIGSGSAWDMVGRHRGVALLPPSMGYDKTHWYRGSADAVYQNLDYIRFYDAAGVLVLSGDHIYQMDYRDMIDYHWAKDADVTISFLQVPLEQACRFGVAELDDEDGDLGGRVVRYEEKQEQTDCTWASMTIFCFKPKILEQVLEANARQDDSHEFGHDIIPRLLREGRKVYGYKFRGYWGYTRTINEYWQTSMDLLGDRPRIKLDEWGLRTNLDHRGIRDFQPAKIGDSANISDSLIYNGCTVEGEVERSILFPGVHIGKGARIKDSVLFFNNVVKQGAVLNKVVSDVNSSFGRHTLIGGDQSCPAEKITVIGWHNHVPDGTLVGQGCTLFPDLEADRIIAEIKAGEVIR